MNLSSLPLRIIVPGTVLAALTGAGLWAGWSSTASEPLVSTQAEDQPKSNVAKFMRGKLKASEHVLEGLVTEDFEKIRKGGEIMVVMSKAADWQVIQGPTYAQYSAEFRRAADRLIKMAKKKQIDSAALAYMHLTMTCINCHKFVKNAKVARGEPISPGLKYALKQDLRQIP